MNFIAKRPIDKVAHDEMEDDDAKMEPIFVVFATDVEKIGKDTINKVITTMEQYSKLNEDNKSLTQFLNALLVVRGGLQPAAKKYLEQCEPFVIETFTQEEVLINITKHKLVPEHTVLSNAEKQQLLKKYRCKDSQLPKIQVSDPIARFFGVNRGQVMKIKRESETAGHYVTYRLAY